MNMTWQNNRYRGEHWMLHCDHCDEKRPAHAHDCPTLVYVAADELEDEK
jgi:hypothetical protein